MLFVGRASPGGGRGWSKRSGLGQVDCGRWPEMAVDPAHDDRDPPSLTASVSCASPCCCVSSLGFSNSTNVPPRPKATGGDARDGRVVGADPLGHAASTSLSSPAGCLVAMPTARRWPSSPRPAPRSRHQQASGRGGGPPRAFTAKQASQSQLVQVFSSAGVRRRPQASSLPFCLPCRAVIPAPSTRRRRSRHFDSTFAPKHNTERTLKKVGRSAVSFLTGPLMTSLFR